MLVSPGTPRPHELAHNFQLRGGEHRFLLRRRRQRPRVSDRVEGEHTVLDPGRADLREQAAGLAGRRPRLGISDVLEDPGAPQHGQVGQSRFWHFRGLVAPNVAPA